MKKKVVVIGGGWAGCGAAISAAKAGAETVLLERTDLLLGTGLAGGYMRNNGRFTGIEEAMALGAGELFECSDSCATNGNRNVEMPGHKHGMVYSVFEIEPLVRKAVLDSGAKILTEHRFTDVVMDGNRIKAVKCANGEVIEGDAFVDCTGSSGSMNNCAKHGGGCCCCILRCPTFGSRVGVAGKAGVRERAVQRPDGKLGVYSGACEVPKETVDPAIIKELEKNSSVLIPVPAELVNMEKLNVKACKQYATREFAENLVCLDNGYLKINVPFFPVENLRKIPGMEKARFEDPYSGGKGNSIRYMAVADVEPTLQAKGVPNLFCGGEKCGPFIGHAEAACTGTLAAHNAARVAYGLEPIVMPAEDTVIGGLIAMGNKSMAEEGEYLIERFTFAGGKVFEWMKEKGLYSTDRKAVQDRIERLGLTGYYKKSVV